MKLIKGDGIHRKTAIDILDKINEALNLDLEKVGFDCYVDTMNTVVGGQSMDVFYLLMDFPNDEWRDESTDLGYCVALDKPEEIVLVVEHMIKNEAYKKYAIKNYITKL